MTTFINFISTQLLHIQRNKSDNREFISVAVACPQSKSGFGTIAVNPKQILPATKKDGTVVDGFSNILLGDADRERKISICTGRKKYKTVSMTNQQIADMFDNERSLYKEALVANVVAKA